MLLISKKKVGKKGIKENDRKKNGLRIGEKSSDINE